MFFLFLFSSLDLLIFDMRIFFHGRLHHSSTVPNYVSIVVAFVTFNIIVDTSISYLSISCIISTVYSLMPKIVARKTITEKETLIPGRKGSSLKWRSLRCFLVMSWLIMVFYSTIGILWTICMNFRSFFSLSWYFETLFFFNVFLLVVIHNTCLVT